MAHSILHRGGNVDAFPPREQRLSDRRACADPELPDDTVTPDLSDHEKNRHRVWRAVSWTLLVNVIVFWLMTCITAYAQVNVI